MDVHDTQAQSLVLRKSEARGHTEADWLHSRHSFSFGDYYDPAHMAFGDLRVINEDWIQPGRGFGMHPHRDMEIITYIIEGELAHQDSLGNGSVIRRGEVQRMTAGAGILHSEMNASATHPVHLLQLWVLPAERGLSPGYEQKRLLDTQRRDAWQLLLSPEGENNSLTIHQDVRLWAAVLGDGGEVDFRVRENRMVWLQVARGSVEVNGERLHSGDGLAVRAHGRLVIIGTGAEAEVLLFDLRKI